MRQHKCSQMARSITITSIILLGLTVAWLVFVVATEAVRWQFLAVAGTHFVWSIVVNKQFTLKNYNYLGIIHTVLTVVFFGYGYAFLD